jgi:sugar (pentulose or hexulose) kinase
MDAHAERPQSTLILDLGETHAKTCTYDEFGTQIRRGSIATPSLLEGDYPALDVERIWDWFVLEAREASAISDIRAINVSAHGACAVLLQEDGSLAFPVLDYEFAGVEELNMQYERIRPDFLDSLSPSLPAGLNLGRQLFWLQKKFPPEFSSVSAVIFYPQYWIWRMTGRKVTERTSLGCHTDLWNPGEDCFSTLPKALNIESLIPEIVATHDCVGNVSDEFAAAAQLSGNCEVFAGVHDSNASLARYIASGVAADISVISMGTWVISMVLGSSTRVLREPRDMLANVSVTGEVVPCARFMGGREHAIICELLKSSPSDHVHERNIEMALANQSLITPSFSLGTGPFPLRRAELNAKGCSGAALATLYLALMIDYELDLLGSKGDIIFGSASSRSPMLCRLVAALRPSAKVMLSGDTASTPLGAWCLTRWNKPMPEKLRSFSIAEPTQIKALLPYRQTWRTALETGQEHEK